MEGLRASGAREEGRIGWVYMDVHERECEGVLDIWKDKGRSVTRRLGPFISFFVSHTQLK